MTDTRCHKEFMSFIPNLSGIDHLVQERNFYRLRALGQMRRTMRWATIPASDEATRKGSIPKSKRRKITPTASLA